MIIQHEHIVNDIFKLVTKTDLISFAAKHNLILKPADKKQDLIDQVSDLFQNENIKDDYYNMFKEKIAYHPLDVQKILNCTSLEYKRWAKEGKISVLFTKPFRAFGKENMCPYYDRRQIDIISQETIQSWRDEHRELVNEHRSKTGDKISQTKRERKQIRQQAEDIFNKDFKYFNSMDQEAGVVFELSFWTSLANRWAKKNQIKIRHARKHKDDYFEAKSQLYNLKTECVKVLSQSKYATIKFYRPDYPDKLFFRMCDTHYATFREDFGYEITPQDAYIMNPSLYDRCSDCFIQKQKEYYSLFFLEIKLSDDIKFSFHTPYDIGKSFYPDISQIQRTYQEEESEGFFRFGHQVTEEEMIKYPEKKVRFMCTSALIKAQQYFFKKKDIKLII